MNRADDLYNEPELNILEKIFFQFYSEKLYEVPESKELKIAKINEAEKLKAFTKAMSSECMEKYYEYESTRNRVESHIQYQSFLLGIEFAKSMEKISETILE